MEMERAGKMLARKMGNGKATKVEGGRRGGLGNEMLCFFHLWREIPRGVYILLIYIPTIQACGWGHHLIVFSCRLSLPFVYLLTRCRIRIRIRIRMRRISLATINHAMSLSFSLPVICTSRVWLVRGAMAMALPPSLHCNCHCGGRQYRRTAAQLQSSVVAFGLTRVSLGPVSASLSAGPCLVLKKFPKKS
jgi:hypothetical protein